MNDFVTKLGKLGMKCDQKSANNKMFIMMDFKKKTDYGEDGGGDGELGTATTKAGAAVHLTLKPCIYKRR